MLRRIRNPRMLRRLVMPNAKLTGPAPGGAIGGDARLASVYARWVNSGVGSGVERRVRREATGVALERPMTSGFWRDDRQAFLSGPGGRGWLNIELLMV